MKKYWPLFAIGLAYLIKLPDSLYLRTSGDPYNYHLYAPLTWARYGLDYLNLFQSTHYQSGILEILMSFVFRLIPDSLDAREAVVRAVQFMSVTVGYLLIPTLIYKEYRSRFSNFDLFCLLCVYWGAEFLLYTSAFAKNDIYAVLFFLLGYWERRKPLKWLFWGLAIATKNTYLYGIVALVIVQSGLGGLVQLPWIMALPSLVWLRNFVVSGNPFFPLPFPIGLQPSPWLQEYFQGFARPQNWVGIYQPILELFDHFRVFRFLGLLVLLAIITRKGVNKERLAILFIPFAYRLLVGPQLEWRTFGGFVILAAFYCYEWVRESTSLNPKILQALVVILGLAGSKLDASSFNRWNQYRNSTYDQVVTDGETWKHINANVNSDGFVLALRQNEGYFLIPRILTLNEHPARESLLQAFPFLEDIHTFLAVQSDASCRFSDPKQECLVQSLLRNRQEVKKDDQGVYRLTLHCSCEPEYSTGTPRQ